MSSRNESAALIANTKCDVLVISRRRFLWALQSFPDERNIFRQIRKELVGNEIKYQNAKSVCRATIKPAMGMENSAADLSVMSRSLSAKGGGGGGDPLGTSTGIGTRGTGYLGGRLEGLQDAFKAVPFFLNSHPRFVELIAQNVDDRLYWPGEVVCRQGEEGNCMYVLVRGEMRVEMTGHEVARLGNGSVLGEVAVLGLVKARSATVTVLSVSWVQILYRQVLDLALKKFPLEAEKLLALGSSRMQKSIKGMTEGLSKLKT